MNTKFVINLLYLWLHIENQILSLAKKLPTLLAMETLPNSLHFLIFDFKFLLAKKCE